jgi:hypothetical protein
MFMRAFKPVIIPGNKTTVLSSHCCVVLRRDSRTLKGVKLQTIMYSPRRLSEKVPYFVYIGMPNTYKYDRFMNLVNTEACIVLMNEKIEYKLRRSYSFLPSYRCLVM